MDSFEIEQLQMKVAGREISELNSIEKIDFNEGGEGEEVGQPDE